MRAAPPRPWWMTALALFCLATVVFLVPRDLLFPDTRDTEVWLGFELHGTAALLTAPIHWAVFLLGAWGFWQRRPWVLPCAAAYVFYVAVSHLIWSEASPNGRGWPIGIAQALVISIPGILLLRARRPMTKVLARYFDAIRSHDWDSLSQCLAPDVRRTGPFRDVVEGREPYVAFLAGVVPSLENYRLEVTRIEEYGGGSALALLTETLDVNGVSSRFPEVMLFDFDADGKIASVDIYIQNPPRPT